MNLEKIWQHLLDDYQFFIDYKERFTEEFLRELSRESPSFLGRKGLSPIVSKLYLLLFSFQKDPRDELFSLSYTLAKYEINLKEILTKTTLKLVRDYVDYLISKDGNFQRIKDLLSLVEIYLSSVEGAYSKYIKEIRERYRQKEKEAVEGERQMIIDFFEKLKSESRDEIEIISYYREVPVVCKSRILAVEEEDVRAQICNLNIFRIGNEVYIKHQNLPRVVVVRIKDLNIPKEEVSLEILGFTDLPQDKRRYVRVTPKDPIPVRVRRDSLEIIGNMADISPGGIGVYVRDPKGLKPGDIVKVRFTLPKGIIEVSAQIRHITPSGEVFRIGFQYELDIKTEEIVSDYVMERQFEILRELKGIRESTTPP